MEPVEYFHLYQTEQRLRDSEIERLRAIRERLANDTTSDVWPTSRRRRHRSGAGRARGRRRARHTAAASVRFA